MWIRGQGRSLVNLDYVTQIEARVMEASYSTSASEPKYELIAYRRPPGADAVLLSMLEGKAASGLLDRLAEAIRAEASVVDIVDLLQEVRDEASRAAAVERVATVDAEAIAAVANQVTMDPDEAAITAT